MGQRFGLAVTVSKVCAFGALVIGLSAMAGWIFGIPTLTQINSHWASMKFNNALCIAWESLTIMLLTSSWSRSKQVRIGVGIFVATVAGLSLFQDLSGIKLGMDELLFSDPNPVKTAIPGRMSPLSALCHLLIGTILFMDLQGMPGVLVRARTFLPPVLLSLGGSGAMGYVFGIEQAYGWGGLTRMAFHTSLAFLLISISLICLDVLAAPTIGQERWRHAPYLAGGWFLVTIVTITIIFHAKQVVASQEDQEGRWTRSMAEMEWGNMVSSLTRLAEREKTREASGIPPDTADMRRYLSDFKGILRINSRGKEIRSEASVSGTRLPPADAVIEYRNAPITTWIDLRCLFPSYSNASPLSGAVRFDGIEPRGDLVPSASTYFPIADRFAIVDLSGATLIRQSLNHRAYYIIGICGFLLAAFSWFTLSSSAKAEERAAEVILANQKLAGFAKELERSNGDLEQFVFIASHDLQTPLRHISGFVKLLLESAEVAASGQNQEFGRYIMDGVERMQKLINGVLEISRVEKSPQFPQAIDLEEVISRAARNLEPDLALAGGSIEIDSGLPTLRGNAVRLSQLFDNLILNSIKYREKKRTLEIRIGSLLSPEKCVVVIEDNGLGIKPEYRERVFQMFQRLHGQSEIKGTGIGLTLCRRIVEQHGGKISLKDSRLGGVSVHIEFPASIVKSFAIRPKPEEEVNAV